MTFSDFVKGNASKLLSFDCAVRFFVRLYKFDAGGLSPVKENLYKMTENMQATVGKGVSR